jgi:hypothetical protein
MGLSRFFGRFLRLNRLFLYQFRQGLDFHKLFSGFF